METVGDRIEIARRRLGISAREVARRAGLGETQVATIVRRYRGNPNAEVALPTIVQLARALDVTLDWLVLGADAQGRADPGELPKSLGDLDDDFEMLRQEGEAVEGDSVTIKMRLLLHLLDDLVGAGNLPGALILVNEAKKMLELKLRPPQKETVPDDDG